MNSVQPVVLAKPDDPALAAVFPFLSVEPIVLDLNDPDNCTFTLQAPKFWRKGVKILPGIVWMLQRTPFDSLFASALEVAAPHALWLSAFGPTERAMKLPSTLATAQSVGFVVPETFVVSTIKEAMELSWKGVCWISSWRDPAVNRMLRLPFSVEDLEGMEGPWVIQTAFPISYGVQVTVVGERIFAVAMNDLRLESAQFFPFSDWRQGLREESFQAEVTNLSAEVAQKCRELVRALGLRTATIDLAVRKESRAIIFMGVSPFAGWSMLGVQLPSGIPREFARLINSSGI